MGLSLRFQSSTYSSSKPNITTPNHSHWNWWLLELNKKDQWFKGKMQHRPLNTTTPKVCKPCFCRPIITTINKTLQAYHALLEYRIWNLNANPVKSPQNCACQLPHWITTCQAGTTEVWIIHLNIWWDKSLESECQTCSNI